MNFDLLILETSFLIMLYYFMTINSYYTLIINLILLLILKGMQLLQVGGDFFVGFLWIIDLNLVFLFILFGFNYTKLLQNVNLNNITIKNISQVNLIFFLIFVGLYCYVNCTYASQKINIDFVSNKMQFINIYQIFQIQYLSNLYVLYLLYFKINALEFLMINVILLLGILIVIFLIFCYRFYLVLALYLRRNINVNYLFKSQNSIYQKYTNNNLFKIF